MCQSIAALLDHVRSYYDALNTGDADRVAEHFTEDATHYYTRLGPHEGARETIEVDLTEGFMMEPEASVSALVFHHPQAKYFSILEEELVAFEQQLAG